MISGIDLSSIVCADQGRDPTRVCFSFAGRHMRAVVCKATSQGAILCIPKSGLREELLLEAEKDDFSGALGPHANVSIIAAGTSGKSKFG